MKSQIRTSVGSRGEELTVPKESNKWLARIAGFIAFVAMYAVFLAVGSAVGYAPLAAILALFFGAWIADKIDPKN